MTHYDNIESNSHSCYKLESDRAHRHGAVCLEQVTPT